MHCNIHAGIMSVGGCVLLKTPVKVASSIIKIGMDKSSQVNDKIEESDND